MVEGEDEENGPGVVDVTLKLAREAEMPILVVEPKTRRVEAVNWIFLEVFGCGPKTLLGARCRELVAKEDRSKFRNLVSILAYGGSKEPTEVSLTLGQDREDVPVSVVGVPNVLEDPTSPVALLCRPRGESIGQPVGPPEVLQRDNDDLVRIPPLDRADDDRQSNERSRSLWG